MFVFVNGYGAPRDIFQDGNYGRYLRDVHAALRRGDVLFLSGGATNREDVTEAEAMKTWFEAAFEECRGGRLASDVRIVMSSRYVRRSRRGIEEFHAFVREECARGGGHRSWCVRVFCEKSRVPTMAFLVGQYFERPAWDIAIRGVAFDAPAMAVPHQLFQAGVKLSLEMAGWFVPVIDEFINEPLRAQHIARARRG